MAIINCGYCGIRDRQHNLISKKKKDYRNAFDTARLTHITTVKTICRDIR
jgi:hypothetical protein